MTNSPALGATGAGEFASFSLPGAVISLPVTTSSRLIAVIHLLGAIVSVLLTIFDLSAAMPVRVGGTGSERNMRRRCISMRSRLQAALAAQLADSTEQRKMFPEGGLIQLGMLISISCPLLAVVTKIEAGRGVA